jgi:hypothetical protein
MTAIIRINMENAAFDEPASELSRILREIAERVENGDSDFTVMDINGNSVGSFNIR